MNSRLGASARRGPRIQQRSWAVGSKATASVSRAGLGQRRMCWSVLGVFSIGWMVGIGLSGRQKNARCNLRLQQCCALAHRRYELAVAGFQIVSPDLLCALRLPLVVRDSRFSPRRFILDWFWLFRPARPACVGLLAQHITIVLRLIARKRSSADYRRTAKISSSTHPAPLHLSNHPSPAGGFAPPARLPQAFDGYQGHHQ